MQIFPDRSFGASTRIFVAFLGLGIVSAGTVLAQGTAADSAAPDPVLATVNGQPIHASDLNAALETLPPQARSMPPQQLYPMLLDQLIDGRALVFEARKTGLDKDPGVERQMQAAQDRALQSALLNKVVRPQVSDEAVKARYDEQVAGKGGEPEAATSRRCPSNTARTPARRSRVVISASSRRPTWCLRFPPSHSS